MSTEAFQEELKTACENGDIDTVRRLIEQGADINSMDDSGNSVLISALSHDPKRSQEERDSVVRLLLQAGADAKQPDKDGFTPLMIAAFCHSDLADNHEIMRMLIDAGAKITGMEGATALTYAVLYGGAELVCFLLESGADVNATDYWGDTAWNVARREKKDEIVKILEQAGANEPEGAVKDLFSAIIWNHPESVKYYLDNGADVNAADRTDDTPLICAIRNWANLEIIRMLLDHDADPEARPGEFTEPALTVATATGLTDVARLLIDHGANISQAGEWPLLNAIRSGSVETVKLLLGAGADANTVDPHVGASSLMVAACDPHISAVSPMTAPQHNSTEIARLLLEHGADISYKVREGDMYNHGGMDTLTYAAYCGTWKLIPLLLDSGADINSRDGLGHTALWHAVTGRSMETVEMLLQRGADVNLRNDDAESPLMQAVRNEDVNIARLLIQHGADVNASIDVRNEMPRSHLHTALSFATWKDNAEIIQILNEAGAETFNNDSR